jgi:AI-2 transport protein TqsA
MLYLHYQTNFSEIERNLSTQFSIDFETIFSNYANQFEFTTILSSLLSTLTSLFSAAFAVFLYLVFLLLEEATFSKKIRVMYPNDEKYEKVNIMISKIDHSVQQYIALKTIVSLATGFFKLFYIAVYWCGCPSFLGLSHICAELYTKYRLADCHTFPCNFCFISIW